MECFCGLLSRESLSEAFVASSEMVTTKTSVMRKTRCDDVDADDEKKRKKLKLFPEVHSSRSNENLI